MALINDELKEVIRLNQDGTAWVNPRVPMSPKAREAVNMLATYASSLTQAHRDLKEKLKHLSE